MSKKFAVWAIDAVSLALLALLAIPTAILAALMGLIWDCADIADPAAEIKILGAALGQPFYLQNARKLSCFLRLFLV